MQVYNLIGKIIAMSNSSDVVKNARILISTYIRNTAHQLEVAEEKEQLFWLLTTAAILIQWIL